MIDGIIFLTLSILALAIGVSIKWGGPPERWGALVLLILFALQIVSNLYVPQIYRSVDLTAVVIDSFALANLAALALFSRRTWPIWATSLQILSLSAHFARYFDVEASEMVYGLMKSVPTLSVLVGLILGTISHRRILRRYGQDPSWKAW